MVVLNLSPEPNWKSKMLKFETPKTNLPKDKKPQTRNNNDSILKKKRFPSFLSPEKKDLAPKLPVPTVPPYPIEYFENNALCHTNRAFDCTEEFLVMHNLINDKPTKTEDGSGEETCVTDNSTPERLNLKESEKVEESDSSQRPVNVKLPLRDSTNTCKGSNYLKPFNTIGIPVYERTQYKHHMKPTGSLKYPSEISRVPLVSVPWAEYECNNLLLPEKKSVSSYSNCRVHANGHAAVPITNGSLKTKRKSLRKIENKIDSGDKVQLPSQTGSSDSDNFPHGGPPPYPGRIEPINNLKPLSIPSSSFPPPPPPLPNVKTARLKHDIIPYHHHRTKSLFTSEHQKIAPSFRHHHHRKSSPIRVYEDSKEILISSLSPPPRLPVKPNVNYHRQRELPLNVQNTTKMKQSHPPIYSKVIKPKKTHSKPTSSQAHLPLRKIPDLSTTSAQKATAKFTKINHRNPSYEDIVDFQDDNESREYNVEVCIDYTKGNKYKFWTTSNRQKTSMENLPKVENKQDNRVENNSNNLNHRLSEINDISSFKLGIIRVIKLGKWRFVALCCCGNTKKYAHQPGRIENYIPGFSTLSEKELKNNPESDVKLEVTTKAPFDRPAVHRLENRRMQMNHALKDTGYESDSTLVFRKREDQRQKYVDAKDTSALYRQIQHGGDIPFSGLQKPAPARPKDDFAIEYGECSSISSFINCSESEIIPLEFSDSDPENSFHPDLIFSSVSTLSEREIMPLLAPRSTCREKWRSEYTKTEIVPSPPRRLSSKWHPSLLKSSSKDKYAPPYRSKSAERVRNARALYSSWHREKVSKSRDRLTSPGHTTTESKKMKDVVETRKNFVLGRRAVSESRFTIKDRQHEEKNTDKYKANDKQRKHNHEVKSTLSKVHSKTSNGEGYFERRLISEKVNNSLPPLQKSYNVSKENISDSSTKFHSLERSNRRAIWNRPVNNTNEPKNMKVSSTKTSHRSHSADKNPQSKVSTYSKNTKLSSNYSTSYNEDKNKMNKAVSKTTHCQSESLDTTHSNETGYSSMLDLTSPRITSKSTSASTRRSIERSSPTNEYRISEVKSLPRNYSRKRDLKCQQSIPGLRTRHSAFFHDRLNKWHSLAKGESVERSSSGYSTRSNSPLRSLEFAKKVSSSFKNIKKEVDASNHIVRSRSVENLMPSPQFNPRLYKEYILELKNAVGRNERISNLRKLFNSLEKLNKLERSLSTAELCNFEKYDHDVIDFDVWKNLHDKKKMAIEYRSLVNKLDKAKKERELTFNVNPPKKWAGDCRLRGRVKNVIELADDFERCKSLPPKITRTNLLNLELEKDTYKGLWRGTSVKDLTKNIGNVCSKSSRQWSELSLTREDSAYRPKGLWTSLSLEQINSVRDQLNEIYGSMRNVRSYKEWRDMKKTKTKKDEVQCSRSHSLDKYDSSVSFKEKGNAIMNVIANSHKRSHSADVTNQTLITSNKPIKVSSKVDTFTEQHRRLSKQLSIELQEKIAENKTQDKVHYSRSMRSHSTSPDPYSRSSPRTCYSLDISDSSEPTSLSSNIGDQFMLVVHKPKRSNSLPNENFSDDSSDSDISIKTVIHRDIAKKVKYFEKKARKNSNSEHYSSKGSLGPTEIPHYATLPLTKNHRRQRNDNMGSGYLPERTVSSLSINEYSSDKTEGNRNYRKHTKVVSKSQERDSSIDSSYSRSYLLHVKTGDVGKLKERYDHSEEKCRSTSLPNINRTLPIRLTPTNKAYIRDQEVGDVKNIRRKYEVHTPFSKKDHWELPKDEYTPKSKIASTLSTLASRSHHFYDPNTVERISRRDSVEKSVLKRVHTGDVEKVVDKFERDIEDKSISLVGQMFTSVPSIPELERLSPFVPPRPPLPKFGPPRPIRSSSYSPKRSKPETSNPMRTSTPINSLPTSNSELSKYGRKIERHIPIQIESRKFNIRSPTKYLATAHIPRYRYTPPISYGDNIWTQSLERPKKLVKAMDSIQPSSNYPRPLSHKSYDYEYSRCVSPTFGNKKIIDTSETKRYSYAFYPPFNQSLSRSPERETSSPQPKDNYSPHRKSCSSSTSQDKSTSSRWKPQSISSHIQENECLKKAQSAFREMKDKITSCSRTPSKNSLVTSKKGTENVNKYPNYNTYPQRRTARPSATSYHPPGTMSKYLPQNFYGTIPPPRTRNVSPTSKSVSWKEPVNGSVPQPTLRRHHFAEPSFADSQYKYNDSEVNIHYKTPVRTAMKENVSESELIRRHDEHMRKIYEQERRKKYLSELDDIEKRRHTDNFTPLQKSPIPLNRYDEEAFSSPIGVKTPEPRQVARVLYNFAAQNKRELTLNKGDVVTIRRMIDRNWYEGELLGAIGIFPSNYVEVVPFDSTKRIGRKVREGQGRARFNFQAQTVMELSLNKGEIVILTRRVDDNWYEGRIGNRRGIFPVSYVDILMEPGVDRHFSPTREPIPRPNLPSSHLIYNGTSGMSSPYSTSGRPGSNMDSRSFSQLTINTQQADPIPYKALYNYKPQNEDELELFESDIVHVMEKCDDGWYVGTSKRTGLFGTFPGNYVDRC